MRIFAAFALVLFVVACAPIEPNPPQPTDRTQYPEGPYGVAEGGVLEALTFISSDDGTFDLNADLYADEGISLLLVSTAASWCGACIEEQPDLQEFHTEFREDGLGVLVSVFEDLNFQPSTAALAADWKSEYSLTFDVVADPEKKFSAYYDESLTPMNMIVDVNTMEILRIQTGFDRTVIQAVIDARLGN